MAVVPYDEGVPFASPAPTPPHDYQEIQANPAEFGGLLAQGEEKAGEGAITAVKFYSQIAAQQAAGNWVDQANKQLAAFKQLKGQDAMTAQPDVLASLKDAEDQGKESLPNADAQLIFSQNVRYLRARYEAEVGNHYDQQAQVWGVGVNDNEAKTALQGVEAGTVGGNLAQINDSATRLTAARIHQAELLYGKNLPPEMLAGVTARAAAERIETQVKALIPLKPDQASALLQASADKLPAEIYEQLSARTKDYSDALSVSSQINDAMRGQPPSGGTPAPRTTPGASSTHTTNVIPEADRPALLQQATAGTPVPPTVLNALVTQESGWDANLPGGAGEVGLGQVKPSTAAQPAFGVGAIDPATLQTPAANLRFSAQYLYGAGKAAGLTDADWQNPAKVAVALKAYNAGGDPDYVQHVMRYMPGGVQLAAASGDQPPVAAPGVVAHDPAGVDRLSQLYLNAPNEAAQRFPGNPKLQDQFVRGMRSNINELMMLQNRDQAIREKAQRDGQNNLMNDVITAVRDPTKFDPKMIDARDAGGNYLLTPEQRENMTRYTNEQLAQHGVEDTSPFGPGYDSVYKGFYAPVGDPNRINSVADIVKHGVPGGDLTGRGVERLASLWQASRRNPDENDVTRADLGLITKARNALTFPDQTIAEGYQIKDRVGEDIFNGQFLPMWYRGLSAARATGDPQKVWDYLQEGNAMKLAASLRTPAQIAQARAEATGMAPNEVAPEKPGTPIPAAPVIQGPEGKPIPINPGAWKSAMNRPPVASGGTPFTHAGWSDYLTRLLTVGTPKAIADFDKHFGSQGYDGAAIVKALTTPRPTPAQITPEQMSGGTLP